ncbi:MAG: site-specific integrase, partial [Desulfobulbaceae bacterium]|nr:site-specific integrase [Desulfobulbaceae bacterium]
MSRNLTDYIQLFTEWLSIEKGYSNNTVTSYNRDLREFATQTGPESMLSDIGSIQVRAYVYTLNGRNKSSSVARKLSALRTFFRFVRREGEITTDPMGTISMPKQDKYMPVFM